MATLIMLLTGLATDEKNYEFSLIFAGGPWFGFVGEEQDPYQGTYEGVITYECPALEPLPRLDALVGVTVYFRALTDDVSYQATAEGLFGPWLHRAIIKECNHLNNFGEREEIALTVESMTEVVERLRNAVPLLGGMIRLYQP